ncbi:leucine-rich repeat-containing protein 70 [Bufo gargarizans]|uniref:leucine-rich repeat-containing protein 70 n=1 Tax=Bufo gargarizans TaxID=30331 RepID=UPI001CF17451|nr:leucine-rich repeat-containing protein 70 [Bufo gargarizans]
MSSKQGDVHRCERFLTPLHFCLCGYVFMLLLQERILCCPTICHICLEKQVNCQSLGLTTIPRSFPKTTTLIYLSGNNITNISPNELTDLKHLAVLFLDNSKISYIHPKAFSSLKKLYSLYLNDNYIQRLDTSIFDGLLNLHYLYLQQNQIDLLPQGLFGHLKSVRNLYLQKNRIGILGSDLFFGMFNLHTLNLANNNISQISDSAWRHLENLENLYLEGNRLMQVPSNALGLLKGLKRLSLSNNQIGSIHNFAFLGLNSLQYLLLENANLQAFSDQSFNGLSNLKQLILSRNEIRTLDSKTFTSLNQLVYLQLDRNGIVAISDDTFEEMGPSLKVLNLAFNNLTSLQPRVLQPLVSLSHLQASYNPWHCGCNLLSLRSFLLSSSSRFSLHCQSPPQLQNRPLGNVKLTEFRNCMDNTTNVSPTLSRVLPTSTEMMHGHMKSVTFKPLLSSLSTHRTFFAQSTSTESINIARSSPGRNTNISLYEKIAFHFPPVNLTSNGVSPTPPDIVTVSLKPVVICEPTSEDLHQSFYILLSFFILSCIVIFFFVYQIIQLKRKLRTPEHQGDSVLEYYSCYQTGRYQTTDPIHFPPQNPLPTPDIDLIRPLKRSPSDSQTQVILFEHSAL